MFLCWPTISSEPAFCQASEACCQFCRRRNEAFSYVSLFHLAVAPRVPSAGPWWGILRLREIALLQSTQIAIPPGRLLSCRAAGQTVKTWTLPPCADGTL